MIELFSKTLHSPRLELRHLEATMENAQIIYEALKSESPGDYKYEPLAFPNILPTSVAATLNMMRQDEEASKNNGCIFYIFHKDKFVGVRKLYFFADTNTLKCATVWFLSSARRHGFAQESFRVIEQIAFDDMKVNRLTRVNIADNESSAILAIKTGFILDGISRQAVSINDGKFYDLMFWSKLRTDYLAEKGSNYEKSAIK